MFFGGKERPVLTYMLMYHPERSLVAGKPEVSVAPLGCPDDGSGLIRAWTLEDCRVSMSVAAAFQRLVASAASSNVSPLPRICLQA